MFKYRQLLEQHADELIRLCTEEDGKTLEELKGSYQRGIECVEFAAGVLSLTMGETVERVAAGVDSAMHREPLGVCVGITPFNFPLMVPLWMFPLAIACGNTFGAEALASRAAFGGACGGIVVRSRTPRRRLECGPRRERRGGRAVGRSAGEGGLVRGLKRGGEVHLPDGIGKRKTRAVPGGSEERIRWSCRIAI